MTILLATLALLTFIVGYVPGLVVQVLLSFGTGRIIFLVPAVIADAFFPFPGLTYVPLVTLVTIVALSVRALLRKYVRV